MAKGFLILISFFTRIPVGNKIEYDENCFVKSLNLYTLLGAVIGFFLAVIYLIFNNVYLFLFKGLLLSAAYLIITGGIHLDGTADTSDGIFSGRPKHKIFEIMSDSHIGTFGTLSLIFVIVSQIILFSYVDIFTLFAVPLVGRLSVVAACLGKKYAKKEKGMGTLFIESIDKNIFIINLLTAIFFILLMPYKLTLMSSLFAVLMLSYFISCKIEDKIGGMTGDTCGFILEVSQILFMIIILFLKG